MENTNKKSNVWLVTGTWINNDHFHKPISSTSKVLAKTEDSALKAYECYMLKEYNRKVLSMHIEPYQNNQSAIMPIGEKKKAKI